MHLENEALKTVQELGRAFDKRYWPGETFGDHLDSLCAMKTSICLF
jgi:hypothetical protein